MITCTAALFTRNQRMPPLKNEIYEASILLISKAVVNIKFIAVAGHVGFVCDVLEVTVVTCTETLTTGIKECALLRKNI